MASMNPQRIKFKENYCNPESETFGNILQSAIKAGFSKSYSEIIMSESIGNEWVKEIIRDYKLVSKAEKNLDTLLGSKDERIKSDMTKFTLSRLNKQKYSERKENTGADGKDLTISVVNYADTTPLPTEKLPS